MKTLKFATMLCWRFKITWQLRGVRNYFKYNLVETRDSVDYISAISVNLV